MDISVGLCRRCASDLVGGGWSFFDDDLEVSFKKLHRNGISVVRMSFQVPMPCNMDELSSITE